MYEILDNVLLSIVIVSYENKEDIVRCLDSIESKNDIEDALEVIVVEQSSSEYIYNYLVNRFDGQVSRRVIRAKNNGFGAGNNIGARNAKGDFLLFLNPDTIIFENLFQRAIDIFLSDSSVGLFGFRLVSLEGDRNQSFYWRNTSGLFKNMLWKIFDRLDIFISSKMYITGADLFIRKQLFDEIGMFDERFFMYYEEPDICNRVQENGFRIRYFSDRKIVHLEGKSDIKWLSRERYKLESAKLYCDKYNYSFKKFLIWKIINQSVKVIVTRSRNNLAQREYLETLLNMLRKC